MYQDGRIFRQTSLQIARCKGHIVPGRTSARLGSSGLEWPPGVDYVPKSISVCSGYRYEIAIRSKVEGQTVVVHYRS